MNDSFVVLMGFLKIPSKKNSFRGFGGVFGGFGILSVLLFLVVEEFLVGSNPSCIFGFWACHYVTTKFITVPIFIGARRMGTVIDHGRGIVNVRAKCFVPISFVLVAFLRLISKREDKFTGVKVVIHSKLG